VLKSVLYQKYTQLATLALSNVLSDITMKWAQWQKTGPKTEDSQAYVSQETIFLQL
jgi:hypothetical protein